MSPLCRNCVPPLPRKLVCLPPWTQRGGSNTRLRVRGWGDPIPTTRTESLALCVLCGAGYVFSWSISCGDTWALKFFGFHSLRMSSPNLWTEIWYHASSKRKPLFSGQNTENQGFHQRTDLSELQLRVWIKSYQRRMQKLYVEALLVRPDPNLDRERQKIYIK